MKTTSLRQLSNHDLWIQTKQAAQTEKEATLALLEYLSEVDFRRLWAERAYGSLFEYIVKELGFSESQASERLNAMRLSREVPEVKEQLQSGALSLTTVAQGRRFFKSEKKLIQKEFSKVEKRQILKSCQNQSKRDVEKILLQTSEAPQTIQKERERRVSRTHTELTFTITEETFEKLEDLKNLLGNDISLSELFDKGLDQLLTLNKRNQGKTQNITPPAMSTESRYIPKQIRHHIQLRSENKCEYRDPLTNKRCFSTYRLQYEHKIPYALGGKTTRENILRYCASHNQLMALKTFGRKTMARYIPDLKPR